MDTTTADTLAEMFATLNGYNLKQLREFVAMSEIEQKTGRIIKARSKEEMLEKIKEAFDPNAQPPAPPQRKQRRKKNDPKPQIPPPLKMSELCANAYANTVCNFGRWPNWTFAQVAEKDPAYADILCKLHPANVSSMFPAKVELFQMYYTSVAHPRR